MEALSLPELAFFAIIITLSYAIRGSAGFGGVTVPLLVYILPLKIVVPVVTFLGVVSSCAIFASDRRYIDWKAVLRVAPATLVGALIGLYFFSALDQRTLTRALGLVIIAYGGYSLWVTYRDAPKMHVPAQLLSHAVGIVAGFVGTLFGSMAGMFYAAYLDLLQLAKNEFRATASAILLGLGTVRGIGYVAVGAFDRDAMIACAAALPLMGIGVFLGSRIHANLSGVAFKRLVAGILILSGIPLLAR